MTQRINPRLAAIGFAFSLLLSYPSFGQDSWGSEEPTSSPPRQSSQSSGVRVFDEKSFSGYDKYRGGYAQFGVTVGEIDFDNGVDVDGGGGFTITGGYRALSWLAAEANFTYLSGPNVERGNLDFGDSEYFAFTFGPKFFPMAAFSEPPIPEFFQPYALVGLGGGEIDIDVNGGGNREESLFIARFIFGLDIWATDHIGAFIEGGYHVADDDDVNGAGVFSFGGQYRF
jgi:hypothetical protein